MSHIKNKNTSIELLVRRRLFAMGYRYRVNYKALPGKPDIVFTMDVIGMGIIVKPVMHILANPIRRIGCPKFNVPSKEIRSIFVICRLLDGKYLCFGNVKYD